MLNIFKFDSLQKGNKGVDIDLHFAPPSEATIQHGRSYVMALSVTWGSIIVVTALLAWFVLPIMVGACLLFAEFSYLTHVLIKKLPEINESGWLLYLPVGFAGYTIYSETQNDLEIAMVLLFLGICVLGAIAFVSNARMYFSTEDDEEILAEVYQLSKESPETAEYIGKVAATGRDYLLKSEIGTILFEADIRREAERAELLESDIDIQQLLFEKRAEG